jgi:hypothetical protein
MRRAIPIYGGELRVFVCDDFAEKLERLRLRSRAVGPDTEDAATLNDAAACVELERNGGHFSIVVLLKPKTTPTAIAHEATHCAAHVWHCIGAKMDVSNDEPFAYLVEWFAEQISSAL